MAERFTRLFQLGNDLYLDGSPVIICAGALLNDTVTGSMIAQIKYQNISGKKIVAAKVKLSAYDAMGTALREAIEYSYTNLNVPSGAYWGSDKAIILPNKSGNSFEIQGIAVAFDDGTNWKTENANAFTSIPASPFLTDELDDMTLVEQYRLETTQDAKYVPKEYFGLWRCTCGCISQGAECTMCHTAKTLAFDALNIPMLSEKASARLEDEARQEAARQEENRIILKDTAIIISIVAVLIAICFIFALWIKPNVIDPARKYKEALALYQNGEYKQAESRFAELGNYRDSEQYLQDIPYCIADDLLEQGKYEAARNAFLELGAYKDSADRALETAYLYAQTLQADGDYISARKWFEDAEPYYDSVACVERLNGLIFEKGVELFEQGSYTDALHYLKEAPATDETKELIDQAETAVEYLDIVDLFDNAGETVNTSEKYDELIEAIHRYQEISEKGKEITGKVLSDDASHMIETYYLYSDYRDAYIGEYSFLGDLITRLCFMKGNGKAGSFALEIPGRKGFFGKEYMTNGSLESEHYRFSGTSELICSIYSSEYIYHRL